jgi:hypothetical protein
MRAIGRQFIFLGFPVLLAYLAFELTPGRAVGPDSQAVVWLFGGLIRTAVSQDVEMFLFVLLLAGLGGFVGAVYNRAAVQHLRPGKRLNFYLIQTAGSSVLGVLFYVLIRAGILTGNTVRDMNPLGMAVLSLGVGISAPAIMRWARAAVVDIYGEEPEVLRAIQRLEDRFERALSEPTLDNFDGTVWIRLLDEAGVTLLRVSDQDYTAPPNLVGQAGADESPTPRGETLPTQPFYVAHAGQRCRLEVRFVPEQPPDKKMGDLYQELRIRRGTPSEEVTFDVALDSLTVDLLKDRLSCTFHPKSSTLPLVFDFVAPEKEGEHQLFVEVSQKNRLLLSVPLVLHIGRLNG